MGELGGAGCVGGGWQESYGYTPGGRMTRKRLTRTTGYGHYLEAAWSYDNEGRMVSVTYPESLQGPGPVYTYSYDAMGRPIRLTENQEPPIDWAWDVVYNPAGQITSLTYRANGLPSYFYYESRQYNARQQLTRLTVGHTQGTAADVEYRYPAAQNDGRITQRKDWISGEEVTYQYDQLNRLISAATTGPEWGQSFAYDGFGNLLSQTVTKGSAPSMQVNVDAAHNRITTGGYSYDANGNLTAMPMLTLGYDVENRLVEATHFVNGTERYVYDAANRRVWKGGGDPEDGVTYFYGAAGEKLGEYTYGHQFPFQTRNRSVWFAGKLISSEGEGVVVDRLGSVVAGPGTQGRKYFPYGEEATTTQQERTKFATYFRDETTALDYADQRYYARTIGRFLTADPYGGSADPKNPQSWNRYSYTRGDPVNRFDRTGLQDEGPDDLVDCGPFGTVPEEACRFFIQSSTRPADPESSSKDEELEQRRIERVARRLISAINAARKALADPRCRELLSGGTAIDPLAVLNGIFMGSLGTLQLDQIRDTDPGYVTSAVTSVATMKPVDIGNGATQMQTASVLIRINYLAGDFVSGGLSEQRTTILHELGHAIYDLYGPTFGSGILNNNYAIQPDRDPNSSANTAKMSKANHHKIREACR